MKRLFRVQATHSRVDRLCGGTLLFPASSRCDVRYLRSAAPTPGPLLLPGNTREDSSVSYIDDLNFASTVVDDEIGGCRDIVGKLKCIGAGAIRIYNVCAR